MKSKLVLLLTLAGALQAFATVTLSTQFGTATNSAGTAVPDGTLWALIVDTNADSTFTGGFGVNSSITSVGANLAFTAGQTISIGSVIGGDTVFALGKFNGNSQGAVGNTFDSLVLTLGTNGLAQGSKFAFYWFPGATYTSGSSASIASQVGGINSNAADAGAGLQAMVIPANGANIATGAATADPTGGSYPAANFKAVNLVPEPSAALLGAIGALGLLRRRRI